MANITRRDLLAAVATGASGLSVSSEPLVLSTDQQLLVSEPFAPPNAILTPEQYLQVFEAFEQDMAERPYSWQTCSVNGRGELLVLDTYESVEEFEERSLAIGSAISVIGGLLLGYVFGTVVDGLVTAVTGQSSAYWFAQAVRRTVFKPFVPSVQIDCYEYINDNYNFVHCRLGGM